MWSCCSQARSAHIWPYNPGAAGAACGAAGGAGAGRALPAGLPGLPVSARRFLGFLASWSSAQHEMGAAARRVDRNRLLGLLASGKKWCRVEVWVGRMDVSRSGSGGGEGCAGGSVQPGDGTSSGPGAGAMLPPIRTCAPCCAARCRHTWSFCAALPPRVCALRWVAPAEAPPRRNRHAPSSARCRCCCCCLSSRGSPPAAPKPAPEPPECVCSLPTPPVHAAAASRRLWPAASAALRQRQPPGRAQRAPHRQVDLKNVQLPYNFERA